MGNIQTSLLSGGVFSRYYKLKGYDVLHVSGSDAHGTRIEYEADRLGVTPQELAQKTHEKIVDILGAFAIDIDNYTITTNPTHTNFIQDIHRQMEENGYIFEKEEERAYCHDCHKFLADRFIEGTCPKCGAKKAHGNQCDACGSLLEPEELIEPHCAVCGGKNIEFRATKHWYLDLEKLEPQLKEYVRDHYNYWQDNVRRFTKQMLDDGLEPRAITRDIKWGIPAPFAGAEKKVIYVWAEAALGYVSATMEFFKRKGEIEKWREYWFSEDTFQIYTHAKDNIPFHTLLFPGQLIASGEDYHLPDQISAGEYLNWVGGKSFSKSKGVGLFADDATDIMDPVYWRFYLMFRRPEKKDVEFSWKELDKIVNKIFIDNASNFINRVSSFAYSRFNGVIPDVEVNGGIAERVDEAVRKVERSVENGSLSRGLREICELGNFGNRYFQKNRPWDTGDKGVVRSSLYMAKAIAIMLEPFVPSFSEEVYKIFDLHNVNWDSIYDDPRGKINEPEPLLVKQDVERMKGEYDQLVAKRSRKREEGKDMSGGQVSFDDFSAMDIRVGIVDQVELLPSADRLYKLSVDIEDDQLTTISGLKQHYSPEELDGKRVIVLTNLEPATIHGEKSECMLLAAEGDRLSLLTTDKDVKPGTNIA